MALLLLCWILLSVPVALVVGPVLAARRRSCSTEVEERYDPAVFLTGSSVRQGQPGQAGDKLENEPVGAGVDGGVRQARG